MTRVCVRHPFEHSDNLCSHCGLEFCRDCMVRPGGARKPALCIPCALAASGVRSTAANRPTISKREIKKRIKERRDEEKVLARLEHRPDPLPPIANPFSSGWALAEEELPPAAALPPPPPPPGYERERVAAPIQEAPRAPTLADLLPTMGRRDESPAAAVASLPTREQELGWDQQNDPEEPDRGRRSLPLLRRREAEPVDDGHEASDMIAWLDEVFAPRDQ